MLIALVTLWGCTKDNGPNDQTEASDESSIQALIASYEGSDSLDYFYADLDEENEGNFSIMEDNSGLESLGKPIIPLHFGRIKARPVYRDLRIVFESDTTATAIFRKVMRGNFVILAADTSTGTDTALVYRTRKQMGHEFTRVAHFVKRNSDSKWRGWKLLDFSLVDGTSLARTDSNTAYSTMQIMKMVIQPSNGEAVEITDPLAYFQNRKNIFNFERGTEVMVTVTVRNSSPAPVIFPQDTQATELVRLHFGRHRHMHDWGVKRFDWIGQDENGDNVYQGIWTVRQRFGVHHAVIDVIDNGTIRDDDEAAYPYNSVTWSTPYFVRFPH